MIIHDNDITLEHLKNNNRWSTSVALQVVSRQSSTVNDNIAITNLTFIRDHDRCQWKGTTVLKTSGNQIIEEANHVKYLIMNGKQYLLAMGADLETIKRASVKQADYESTQNLMLDDPDMGGTLWGRIYGNNGMDIYKLLEQSQSVQCRKSDIAVDGVECYEIDGTCKYGNIKIIYSPQKGCCPLKWEISKKPGDYFDGKRLDAKHWIIIFQAKEINNIEGFYVPMKGRIQHDVLSKDEQTMSLVYDYELSNVLINPVFETIHAFEFDLPASVPVTLETSPGVIYHFINGKLVAAGV